MNIEQLRYHVIPNSGNTDRLMEKDELKIGHAIVEPGKIKILNYSQGESLTFDDSRYKRLNEKHIKISEQVAGPCKKAFLTEAAAAALDARAEAGAESGSKNEYVLSQLTGHYVKFEQSDFERAVDISCRLKKHLDHFGPAFMITGLIFCAKGSVDIKPTCQSSVGLSGQASGGKRAGWKMSDFTPYLFAVVATSFKLKLDYSKFSELYRRGNFDGVPYSAYHDIVYCDRDEIIGEKFEKDQKDGGQTTKHREAEDQVAKHQENGGQVAKYQEDGDHIAKREGDEDQVTKYQEVRGQVAKHQENGGEVANYQEDGDRIAKREEDEDQVAKYQEVRGQVAKHQENGGQIAKYQEVRGQIREVSGGWKSGHIGRAGWRSAYTAILNWGVFKFLAK